MKVFILFIAGLVGLWLILQVPSKKKETSITPHQCQVDTIYVQNDKVIDSLTKHIKNQDRYILIIENENQILGSYRAQMQH